MIRHIVLTRLKPDVQETAIAAVYAGLSAVVACHPGARNFCAGRSASPEQMERGYGHGFTIDFDDWAALDAYAQDPEHRALGAQLVALAQDGLDGLIVLDIEVPQ
ncbi:MAG: Stress responsive A/B Barrel Domain [Roseibaca calidilacus]|uniref:Stress responsive A/B Barrel Domain n=1 Tax=Roseibaca calidilacus TaxID=1666912 RepID=A0A0P7WHV0_9RHOB|nr:Dabb family protein [Roseibaca calidilacus]KPP93586.1 MAG: Stress responsive A/B Barrel Domain [Roseibaca calidilacus]CUX80407.1 Stress responsive A/B Barrel Domain [Roseibaca calidilacus]